MIWQWIAAAAIIWAGCCALLAVVMRIRWRRSSSLNPIEWIPFYIAAPLALVGLIFAYIFILPPLFIGQAIGMSSWARRGVYAHRRDHGVALCTQDETVKRLLRWADLLEWREEFTHPMRTYTAIMKSGEEIHVDFLADHDVLDSLESHGVSLTYDPLCRAARGGHKAEPDSP